MTEHIANTGAWGIALIVAVVVSWFLYRYLAPRTWKEWASASVNRPGNATEQIVRTATVPMLLVRATSPESHHMTSTYSTQTRTETP